jgi:hypothetical protein
MVWLSAQERDDIPPPSNRAVEDRAPSKPAQLSMSVLCEGATGLMPGVAISVEPSGMPAGCVDPLGRGKVRGEVIGEVTDIPAGGCTPEDAACAKAGTAGSHAAPMPNDVQRTANAILRDLNCGALRLFEESGPHICGAPALLPLIRQ